MQDTERWDSMLMLGVSCIADDHVVVVGDGAVVVNVDFPVDALIAFDLGGRN